VSEDVKKMLFIGGLIPEDKEIEENTINFMNNAANAFQKQFIGGLKENGVEPIVVSAPFIGPYPKSYKKLFYRPKEYHDGVKYVPFFNLWGLRNFSRTANLKKEIRRNGWDKADHVLVYSVHTPFSTVAKYIKKKNPSCKICLITPDLPEFMNLRSNKTLLYKIAKKFDCRSFYSKIKYYDSFVLVSKHQSEKVNTLHKPEVVIEAIAKDVQSEYVPCDNHPKQVVYTGALNAQFGVLDLMHAFQKSKMDAKLIFCGDGDAAAQIREAAQCDSRIVYRGVLPHEEARKAQKMADVLVNPRQNEGEYTKYSFPSKTLEYLGSGRVVVCNKLDGIPDEYDDFLIYPKEETPESFAEAIEEALQFTQEECEERFARSTAFLRDHKNARAAARKILDMMNV
jgi:glycosyltransferase involved in cell wall biosynthesis